MISPRAPEDATTAPAWGAGYPRRTMDGIRIEPIADVVAGAEPEIAPKKADAPVETCASPPGKRPSNRPESFTRRSEICAAAMILPARRKSGMARKGKLFSPLNSFCGMIRSGILLPK